MATQQIQTEITLGKRLGEGHFAPVYEAEHRVQGAVAAKVYTRLDGESDDAWEKRRNGLLAEGVSLRQAKHERIVGVYDVAHDQSQDSVFLIMECCPQGSIESHYANGPLDLESVRTLISDATLGLSCVHGRGLLHRDIKPANILLDATGRAKLADFGLVTDDIVLGYASARGYSDHLAKEVWECGTTSRKSDIWALGMTTYRLMHGMAFYQQQDEPRFRVQDGGFAHSLKWLPHIPAAWQRFIRKAMHDDPALRIQSAEEFLQGLGTLPTHPNWSCDFTPDRTTWTKIKKNRVATVVHVRHSPRRHEWHAESSSLDGGGRKRTLGGSGGVIGLRQAENELRSFLIHN